MMKEGFATALVDDFGSLPDYWNEFLKDFPDHPVRTRANLSSCIPCTLYCHLVGYRLTLPYHMFLSVLYGYDWLENRFRVSGDEINSLGDSWMFLVWTSDVSPFLTNSMSSRLPIAVIPASRYTVGANGINLTLQAAATAIKNSFNQLSTRGVKVRDSTSLQSATVTR